jgi:DNA-binding MltR family transcriptional regulator
MVDQERHEGRDAFGEFMDEFMKESDRACIILASAEMEARFELLFGKFLKANAKLRKDLLSFIGPLGSFGAKVKMAYALGIITKDFYDLLELFRSIRNKIVHKGTAASLAEPDIKELSDRILEHFRKSMKFKRWAFRIKGLTKDQYQFRHALSFIIVMIEHTTKFLNPVDTVPHSCDPEEYILDDKKT